MAESPPTAVPALRGLAIEAVEWLPSGSDSGLVRVRGRWADEAAREPDLPTLILRAGGEERSFDSLPDARFDRDPASWRGTYVVPAGLVATGAGAMWLQWSSGTRAGLPPLSRVEPRSAAAAPDTPEEPGGQVIDRAVLAERRARRAEAAEEAQSRVASEALKAVEALELRSADLERRLEEATASQEARAADTAGRQEALAAALASAAELRSKSREWQLRLRTSEVARSSDAVRLAVLETERVSLRGRTAELEELRREASSRATELADATEAAATARAELERERAAADEARAGWDRRRAELETALEKVRGELDSAREEAAATAAELVTVRDAGDSRQVELEAARRFGGELESALVQAKSRLQIADTMLAAAEARLRVETVARSTLEDQLDRERAKLEPLRAEIAAALAEIEPLRAEIEPLRAEIGPLRAEIEPLRAEIEPLRAERESLRAEVEPLRAESESLRAEVEPLRARSESLQAESESLRAEGEALRAEIEPLRAELAGAHARIEELLAEREAARAEADGLRSELEAERSARAAAEGALAATPEARTLPQLASEQAEAAAAVAPAADADRMASDLDAAADALRRSRPATPEHRNEEPQAENPPLSTPSGPKIVSPKRPPARGLVVGSTRRDYPRLRGAIVKLAHDDHATAGRLLAALLTAQGALLESPVAYDLTIREVGTYGVTVAGNRTYVVRLERPRPRGEADFHLAGDALVLAEMLAGVDHRIGRFFGRVRVRGRRRRVEILRGLSTAGPTLSDVARAGAKLDPGMVYRTFAYAVHPSWTHGHSFTVAQEITGGAAGSSETWYLTARDGAGLTVSSSSPGDEPDATVTMSRAAFDCLLRGEPAPAGERPVVRGDREAVDRMRMWTLRAQGVERSAQA